MRLNEALRKGGERTARCGSTLIELLIVSTLFVVVFLSSVALIESGSRFSSATLEISALEDMAEQMLFKIEREVANASAIEPEGTLTTVLGAAELGGLTMTSTAGFPPTGDVLVNPGQPNEERLSYTSLNVNGQNLNTLERGVQCTEAGDHGIGSPVLWMGLARPIDDQGTPPADTFDGEVEENGVRVFYRGDGSGFSYRVPTDDVATPEFSVIDANGELLLGAEVRGIGETLTGRCALYYQPVDVYTEANTGDDINRDGDTDDVFDVGQIRRIRWDTTNPLATNDDVGWGPSAVLQERCNWGGDLDNDGFDDPIFLWDETTGQLHTRLYILGRSNEDMPIVRRVESVAFLRNTPEV